MVIISVKHVRFIPTNVKLIAYAGGDDSSFDGIDSNYVSRTRNGYTDTITFKKACSGYFLQGNKHSPITNPSGTATITAVYTNTQYFERTLTFSAQAGQTIVTTWTSQYGYHLFTAG